MAGTAVEEFSCAGRAKGGSDMVSRKPEISLEAFLSQLMEDAKERWGEGRAEELRGSLEQTAQNLYQIATNPPNWEVEPGFYPGLYQ